MAQNPNHSMEDELPLSPEEMKAIGEIELGPSRHELFLNAHYKKLIVVTLVVMLLATAAIVYGTWRARQEADGAAAALAAMNVPSGAAAEASEYDLATLDKLIATYSGTKAAATAELMRGMQLVSGGQVQEGITVLERIAAGSPEPLLRVRAQVFLAGYYMSGGDTQKATDLWLAITRAGQTPYLALAYLSLGDLAQEAGDIEQARSYYKQLQESCTASPLQLAVQQRLLLLGVDAPTPVAPPAADPSQSELPGWSPMLPTPGAMQLQ